MLFRCLFVVCRIDLPGTMQKLQSFAPEGWYPDFLEAPGTPLGEAVFDGRFTFKREWTGVSVAVNVQDGTFKLDWKRPAAAALALRASAALAEHDERWLVARRPP